MFSSEILGGDRQAACGRLIFAWQGCLSEKNVQTETLLECYVAVLVRDVMLSVCFFMIVCGYMLCVCVCLLF